MVELRKTGTMSAVVCSDAFLNLARTQARVFGAPDLPLITIRHPVAGLRLDAVGERAETAIGQTVQLIREQFK